MKVLLQCLLAVVWLHAGLAADASGRMAVAEKFMKGKRFFAASQEYEALMRELKAAGRSEDEAMLQVAVAHVEALAADEQHSRCVKAALAAADLAERMLKDKPEALAECWTKLAGALGNSRRIDLAGKLLERVMSLAKNGEEKALEKSLAMAEMQVGVFFVSLQRFEEAMTHLRKALQLAEKATGQDSELVAKLCQHLARAVEGHCAKTGSDARRQEGKELCRRSLDIAIKLHGSRSGESVALAVDELSISYQRAGETERALDLALEAVEMAVVDISKQPESLGVLMEVYAQLMKVSGRQAQGAEKIAQWVEAVKAKSDDSLVGLGTMLHAAGKGYAILGYSAEAENAYWNAMKTREAALGKDDPETARSLMNVAILVQARGDLINPESMIKRCIAIDEKQPGGWSSEAQLARLRLLGLHVKQGRMDDALAVQKAIVDAERQRYGHARQTGVGALVVMAEYFLSQKNLKLALQSWKDALSAAMESPADHHALGLVVTVPILQAAHGQNAVLAMEPTLRRFVVLLGPLAEGDEALQSSLKEWKRLYTEALSAARVDVAVVADRLAKMAGGNDPGDLKP